MRRGSEWLKWDLHIHTLHTYLNCKYNCDYKTLAYKIVAAKINVIGLTDYFVIEENEFNQLKAELPSNINIILNYEFRINDKNKDGEYINIHVLFNPETTSIPKVNESLARVKLNNLAGDTAKYCTIESVKEFGADHITVSIDDLTNQLENDFKPQVDYLIVGVCNGYGGFRPDDKPRNIQLAKKIDEVSDLIFGRQQDTEFFLNRIGERSDTDLEPKAVVACSDAHSIEDIGSVFTWIKGSPNFSGLRQIIYEPETRVKIKQDVPDYKKDYLTIDNVKFITEDKRFQPDRIYLSKNLNSIIGGKSSGKSLLLFHIAKTVAPNLVSEIHRRFDKNNKPFGYEIPDFDFEVTWSDGLVQKLSDSTRQARPITYVPQFYINEIAENTQDRDALNSLIFEILKGKGLYKQYLDDKLEEVQKLKEKISLDIVRYFNIAENINTKKYEISEIGEPESIKSNIDKLIRELEELRKESDFSEEDEQKYKCLFEKKETYLQQELSLSSTINGLSSFEKDLSNILRNEECLLPNVFLKLQPDLLQEELSRLFLILKDNLLMASKISVKSFLQFAFKSRLQHYQSELMLSQKDIRDLLSALKPFEEKLKNKERFDKIQQEINEERAKLSDIEQRQKELNRLIEEQQGIKLLETYSAILDNYKLRSNKNLEYRLIGEEIELTSIVSFNLKKFDTEFVARITKNSTLQNQISPSIFSGNSFVFNIEEHINHISTVFDFLISGKLSFNQGTSIKEAISGLLSDCFTIEFDLLQGGDKLLHMSPGKRGLVLFQLFLKLSNSVYPILIDQPEDNLDNRTVYQQLNSFIKKRKSDRQIIMASHNANLVVSTDSENVIVANQHGQNSESQKKEFNFEYVNGALEQSFKNKGNTGVLFQKGIREHVCEILEGGEDAFLNRERKYGLK